MPNPLTHAGCAPLLFVFLATGTLPFLKIDAANQWDALTRYCDNGRIEIDNNAAERALRCVALGRKNYLFMGSDAGGNSAAAIYSLLGTAKLNGDNPEAFLREVLTRLADHPINRINELLPWHLQPADPDSLASDDTAPELSA